MRALNKNGQSSLDFIIAIIFAIIFFQSFVLISGQARAMQEDIAIRAQLKGIAANAAEAVSAAQALNEPNANFIIEYKTPKVASFTRPKACTITITTVPAPGLSTAGAKLDTDPAETAGFVLPSGITINNSAPLECGETITIAKP
ncbi:MAG: hypothetical protein PHH08_04890 [Candidatus ainarchaeum sp.]|nr:hypothetical protein [Candidatus ainarchaeum sp.]